VNNSLEHLRAKKMRVGWLVGVALAVATVVEYYVAVSLARPLVPLAIVALIKAWFIVVYFMHIKQLWTSEEGGH